MKLIFYVNDPSELYRFAVELSNNAAKLNAQYTQRKTCYSKDLVKLCRKIILLTDDNFKNYKYLLNQNIELFLN